VDFQFDATTDGRPIKLVSDHRRTHPRMPHQPRRPQRHRQLALIGSAPHRAPAVAIFDLGTADVRELAGGQQLADERFISLPQPFDYPTRDGDTGTGSTIRPPTPTCSDRTRRRR
jgi:dipeptidyl aminopeptidase/acylaminoacyl peptidase